MANAMLSIDVDLKKQQRRISFGESLNLINRKTYVLELEAYFSANQSISSPNPKALS